MLEGGPWRVDAPASIAGYAPLGRMGAVAPTVDLFGSEDGRYVRGI